MNKDIKVIETRGSYTLLNRGTEFQPYVVAYKYDRESQAWSQGHYFSIQQDAEYYFNLQVATDAMYTLASALSNLYCINKPSALEEWNKMQGIINEDLNELW